MIKVSKVEKNYGVVKAVSDISFDILSKEKLVILGPSGSGKTTLLRLIAGLEMPSSGEIYIDGNLVSRCGWTLSPEKRNLGFVFQAPALWTHMTVEQNILFGVSELSRSDSLDRLEDMLYLMEISDIRKRYPDEISGGQAKRVSIARTLAPRPKHLLMDEPLTNLNKELRENILSSILDYIKGTGGNLIYVTHDEREAKAVNGKVITLCEN